MIDGVDTDSRVVFELEAGDIVMKYSTYDAIREKKIFKRIRKGLTLIEAAMVLTILALVIGGVMLYYSSASTSRQVSQAVGQLGSLQQSIRSAFAGQPDYAGLTSDMILSSVPASMVSGSTLKNAFGSSIDVAEADTGGGAGSGFSVTFNNVPMEACLKLAVLDLGRQTYSVDVNGTNTTGTGVSALTPTQAKDACVSSSPNVLAWTFY